MYTPINLTLYTAAFSGAMAGLASGRSFRTNATSTFATFASQAGAFAQEVDQLYNNALPIDDFQAQEVQAATFGQFQDRGGNAAALLTAANYAGVAAAVLGMLTSGESYLSGQGIVPNKDIGFTVLGTTVDAASSAAVDSGYAPPAGHGAQLDAGLIAIDFTAHTIRVWHANAALRNFGGLVIAGTPVVAGATGDAGWNVAAPLTLGVSAGGTLTATFNPPALYVGTISWSFFPSFTEL